MGGDDFVRGDSEAALEVERDLIGDLRLAPGVDEVRQD